MHFSSPAEIFGVDGIIVLIVVVLVLFGSTQIPKLARSLGSAQKEFKKGVHEGGSEGAGKTMAIEAAPLGAVTTQNSVTVESANAGSSVVPS